MTCKRARWRRRQNSGRRPGQGRRGPKDRNPPPICGHCPSPKRYPHDNISLPPNRGSALPFPPSGLVTLTHQKLLTKQMGKRPTRTRYPLALCSARRVVPAPSAIARQVAHRDSFLRRCPTAHAGSGGQPADDKHRFRPLRGFPACRLGCLSYGSRSQAITRGKALRPACGVVVRPACRYKLSAPSWGKAGTACN